MAIGKRNKVSFDFANYIYTVIGQPKVGKTSLIYNVCKQITGRDDALLSINIGNEHGYELIEGLVYEEVKTWAEFTALIKELVTHPEDNHFKFISLETIDQLVSLAEQEACRIADLESKTGKKNTINSAFGGYGRGKDYARNHLIADQINALVDAKYGIFFVGHTSTKTQTDMEGISSKTVTNNLEAKYFDFFANMSSVIAVLTSENEYSNLQTDTNGNIIGKIANCERWIYFRSTDLITAGSRLTYIPNRVPLSATNFIESVREGLMREAGFDGNMDEFNRKASDDEKQREATSVVFAEGKLREDYFTKIKEVYPYSSAEVQQSVKDFIRENGFDSIQELVSNAELTVVEQLVSLL